MFTQPRLTKKQLILHKLMGAGDEGVHSFDLVHVGGFRYSARVNDLKKQGFNILSVPEKKGTAVGCRYFLKG